MKNPIILFVIALLIVAGTGTYMLRTSAPEANIILTHGVIYTLDEGNTVVDAVALSGNRIAAIGTSTDLTARYPKAQVIDLQGKTVLPGLVDAHVHMLGEGTRMATLDLVGTTSAEEIAGMVAQRVKAAKEGEWIIGRGWDQNDWKVEQFPDAALLDQAAPTNPVVLRRVDGHAMWLNSAALNEAGIVGSTPDIEGGKIYRDKDGKPTGILVDNATELVTRVMPDLTDSEIEERLKAAMQECVSLGLTEVHDMGVDLQTLEAYKRIIDAGKCPLRIYAAIGHTMPADDKPGTQNAWRYYLSRGPEKDYGNGFLSVRAVKLYMDGALGSRGAALLDEYSDDHGNRGLTVMHESQIDSICRQALDHGFQVCVHAIGDRANNIILNRYEEVLNGRPGKSDTRWRIEHAQVLKLSDIPRFASLGVLPSMQPTHATSDMPWAEQRLGAERLKGAYAWKSLLKAGSHIVAGSDFPVEGVNPLWGFYAAVTRMDHDGNPPGGWTADEVLSREEAARAFTQWASYAAFQEEQKGTITPGKWADLTVLSGDIMQAAPAEILNTKVEMTIVNGKIVYQKHGAVTDEHREFPTPAP